MIYHKKFVFLLPPLIILSFFSVVHAYSDNCRKAIELYNQSLNVDDFLERENILKSSLLIGCEDKKIVAKIHNNLADTYENQDLIKKAIAEYEKACKIDPYLATPYLSLGDIYTKLKRPKEASKYYEKGFLAQNYKSDHQIIKNLSPVRSIRVKPKINLYFGLGQAQLSVESERQLKALLSAFEDPELLPYRFRLAGHTCSLGTQEYNQALSIGRAKAVKQWLLVHKILDDRLVTVGFGEDRPISDNNSEDGRRRNRRVEISTIGVADVGLTRGLGSQRQVEGLELLKQGEKLLADEQYEKAVEHFERALEAFKKVNFDNGIKAALKDLRLAHRYIGNWDRAKEFSKRSLQFEN